MTVMTCLEVCLHSLKKVDADLAPQVVGCASLKPLFDSPQTWLKIWSERSGSAVFWGVCSNLI